MNNTKCKEHLKEGYIFNAQGWIICSVCGELSTLSAAAPRVSVTR